MPPVGSHLSVAIIGLAIYLFAIHSYKLQGFQLPSIGLAVGFLGVLSSGTNATVPRPLLWLLAWLAWSTAGVVVAQNPTLLIEDAIIFAKLAAIMFIAYNAMNGRRELLIVALLWLTLYLLYPARGTYFNFLFGIGTFGRYGWNFSFANYNDLAAYTLLLLSLAGFLAFSEVPRTWKLAMLGASSVLAVLVIITQSRGAFVALAVSTLLYARGSMRRRTVLKVLAALCALVIVVSPQAVWERFARMKFLSSTETFGQADSSAEQRFLILEVATQIIKDHPVTGVGLGNYGRVHSQYAASRSEWAFAGGERDTHNTYANIWAETGIIGLLLFLAVPGSTLLTARRAERLLRTQGDPSGERMRILRYGLIAFLLASVFGTMHRISFLYLYCAITVAAAAHLTGKARELR